MSFNVNANTSIADTGIITTGQFTSRATLPTGTAGYLAYVADQNEFVMNIQQVVHPSTTNVPPAPTTTTNSPDNGVTWYKFKVKPNDYKNEVILEQGTLGGGYSGSGIWSTITRITYSSDVANYIGNMSFASKYAAAHSTYLYAYYQQGWADNGNTSLPGGCCKQDWATFSVTTVNPRPNASTPYPSAYQFGPKLQNLYGFIYGSGTHAYLTFSSDTWTTSSVSFPTAGQYTQSNGYGANFGYVYSSSMSNTWKIAPGTFTATQTSSGGAPGGGGNNGGHPTKWNKHYVPGAANNYMDVYNHGNDTFTNGNGRGVNSIQEITAVAGQDWGYWYAYQGGYTGQALKQLYASDTTISSSITNLPTNTGNSASGCWGPLP